MDRGRPIDLGVPRTTGEILGAAGRLYRSYPLLFLVLAAGVMVPFELIVLAATGEAPLHRTHESLTTSVSLDLLRTLLVGALISALHIHAVVQAGREEHPRLGEVTRRGLRVLPVVAAAAAASSLITPVGFICLIVPGVLLALMLAVSAQAAALEGRGWTAALRSSRNLTDSHYGHVFGLLFVTGALALAADVLARALPLGSATGAAAVAVGIAVDTATASFGALMAALLYFDLKSRATAPASESAAA